MVSTRHLQHFAAVMETGSFLSAARKVHISQPALSKSIGAIESFYQAELFVRTPRGVVPTEFALALQPYAERILRDLSQSQKDLQKLSKGVSGTIRMGIGASFVRAIPIAIRKLEAESRQIQFTVITDHAQNMRRRLLENRIDFYLGMVNLEVDDPEFLVETLFTDQFMGVCAPHHPFANRCVPTSELANALWVTAEPREPVRRMLEAFFTLKIGRSPDIRMETNSDALTRNMVLNENCVSLMPRANLHLSEAHTLSSFEAEGFNFQRIAGIVKRSSTLLPPLQEHFIGHLKAAVMSEAEQYSQSQAQGM